MQISENDLADARQSWGDGLIKISQIFESSCIDEGKSFASSLTDNLYGFDFGPILLVYIITFIFCVFFFCIKY